PMSSARIMTTFGGAAEEYSPQRHREHRAENNRARQDESNNPDQLAAFMTSSFLLGSGLLWALCVSVVNPAFYSFTIFSTRPLLASEMSTWPVFGWTATPCGWLNSAFRGSPPTPAVPCLPVPATASSVLLPGTYRTTRWFSVSAISTDPSLSTHRCFGPFI